MNGFYQKTKLKAHFKDQTNKPKTEENIFRKPTNKTWIPAPPKKNHHTIEISIEATNKEINEKQQNIQTFRKQNKKV